GGERDPAGRRARGVRRLRGRRGASVGRASASVGHGRRSGSDRSRHRGEPAPRAAPPARASRGALRRTRAHPVRLAAGWRLRGVARASRRRRRRGNAASKPGRSEARARLRRRNRRRRKRKVGAGMNVRRARALIAEDEAPARESLREYLATVPGLEIVGEAVDGKSALALAEARVPDLLFLDVRLPELSGLDVARRIRHRAEIIFTTAYDRFAVAAFEIGAIDYLVKPFGRERLASAVERALARLGQAPVFAGDRARDSLVEGPLARLFA